VGEKTASAKSSSEHEGWKIGLQEHKDLLSADPLLLRLSAGCRSGATAPMALQ
jgi:hypothetical protein